jgi:hypothetical protein
MIQPKKNGQAVCGRGRASMVFVKRPRADAVVPDPGEPPVAEQGEQNI